MNKTLIAFAALALALSACSGKSSPVPAPQENKTASPAPVQVLPAQAELPKPAAEDQPRIETQTKAIKEGIASLSPAAGQAGGTTSAPKNEALDKLEKDLLALIGERYVFDLTDEQAIRAIGGESRVRVFAKEKNVRFFALQTSDVKGEKAPQALFSQTEANGKIAVQAFASRPVTIQGYKVADDGTLALYGFSGIQSQPGDAIPAFVEFYELSDGKWKIKTVKNQLPLSKGGISVSFSQSLRFSSKDALDIAYSVGDQAFAVRTKSGQGIKFEYKDGVVAEK